MQKILKWFAPVVTLGVAIFLLFFIMSINSQEQIATPEPLVLEKEAMAQEAQPTWLSHFSKSEKLGYFYPVTEVYVQVDLSEKIVPKTTYKLSASLLDPYQLFCLKEELKNHNLPYYFKKDTYGVELLIFSQDINRLNSLVNVLKNYQIVAQITPYKEDA